MKNLDYIIFIVIILLINGFCLRISIKSYLSSKENLKSMQENYNILAESKCDQFAIRKVEDCNSKNIEGLVDCNNSYDYVFNECIKEWSYYKK